MLSLFTEVDESTDSLYHGGVSKTRKTVKLITKGSASCWVGCRTILRLTPSEGAGAPFLYGVSHGFAVAERRLRRRACGYYPDCKATFTAYSRQEPAIFHGSLDNRGFGRRDGSADTEADLPISIGCRLVEPTARTVPLRHGERRGCRRP